MLAHLLIVRYAQGPFCGKIGENLHTVESTEDSIIVDGKEIKTTPRRTPRTRLGQAGRGRRCWMHRFLYQQGKEPGPHRRRRQEGRHFHRACRQHLKTIVFSVNEDILTKEDKIISTASCTTNCLAPMAKALNDAYPIVSGIMCTVHAYTGDQMILDGPHRRATFAAPAPAPQHRAQLHRAPPRPSAWSFPELKGKLIGSAQRVAVPTVPPRSCSPVIKGKDVTVDGINAIMKAAPTTPASATPPIPSCTSDVIGMKYGSLSTRRRHGQQGRRRHLPLQTVAWYDNENSYTSQMVRTIKFFAELGLTSMKGIPIVI
jgi:glyceraldehyde 3-phosphate dehydrogenase